MPVDLFTPALVALAAIVVPIFTAIRGTPWSFVTVVGIELVLACLFYVTSLAKLDARANGAFFGVCILLYLVPQVVGLAIVAHRRQVKVLENARCSTCGYDLRATPDRCPECGAIPPPPSA